MKPKPNFFGCECMVITKLFYTLPFEIRFKKAIYADVIPILIGFETHFPIAIQRCTEINIHNSYVIEKEKTLI